MADDRFTKTCKQCGKDYDSKKVFEKTNVIYAGTYCSIKCEKAAGDRK